MSDATRAVAISEAIKLAGFGDDRSVETVLATAKQFDDFLNATGETTPAKVSTPGKEPAKKPAVAAKPAGKKTPAKTEEQLAEEVATPDEEAEGEPETPAEPDVVIKFDKDGVQASVAKMLEANKRKEAIALLKKFGAASAGGVKAKDFKAFITEALKIAGEGDAESDDLTA